MSPKSSVGPNDPCPCGSNKKYKRCCKAADGPSRPKWKGLALGVLVAAGAAVLILGPANRSKGASSVSFGPGLGTTSGVSVPQPAGPVPPGKVWSPAHGHWHDAANAAAGLNTSLTTNSAGGVTPQPAGPVPEGKVWSPEHGHWHTDFNAAAGLGSGIKVVVDAPAPAPAPAAADEPPITIRLDPTP